MKGAKVIGIVLLTIGAIVLPLSLLVDLLGYGNPGFAMRQIAGTIAGAVAIIAGLILVLKK